MGRPCRLYQKMMALRLIYIDRHLVHEITSPLAFEGLRLTGRKPWRQSRNLAVADHNVPTTDRDKSIADPVSRLQVETLDKNCAEFGITEFAMTGQTGALVICGMIALIKCA